MTDWVRLPTELYRPIIESTLERKDILNLCLVSKIFSTEAYRVLYRKIIIKDIQTLELVLRTLISSPNLSTLIHTWILDIHYNDYWVVHFSDLIIAVNGMTNLKRLHLSRSGAGEGNYSVVNWTKELRLPHLETLSLLWHEAGPIKDMFAERPYPLPHVLVNRGHSIDNLDGINHLMCTSWYAGSLSKPVLHDLKILETSSLAQTTLAHPILAPNLHTIAYTGLLSDFGDYNIQPWHKTLLELPSVSRIGPVYCPGSKPEPTFSGLSQFSQLEVAVLFIIKDEKSWHKVIELIKRWFQTSTRLRRVFVLGLVDGKLTLELWETNYESEGHPKMSPDNALSHQILQKEEQEWRPMFHELLGFPYIKFYSPSP